MSTSFNLEHGWKCAIESRPWESMHLALHLFRHQGDFIEKMEVTADNVLVHRVKPAEAPLKPTIQLPPDTLRAIFEALWEQGFRPKDRRYDTEIELLQAHKEDLRKLLFKHVGIRDESVILEKAP